MEEASQSEAPQRGSKKQNVSGLLYLLKHSSKEPFKISVFFSNSVYRGSVRAS